ncbi:MAG: carboxymuconolactone decarboxylase family protein [Dehalococcoidaceae bacterium]|nr:carboxymuconolactone decarboxylase family protein [Dehalococcoidaceae bacterium]
MSRWKALVSFYPSTEFYPEQGWPVVKFKKRIYRSARDFFKDLWFPVRNMNRLREITRKGLISPAFRERLMLAVTAVNGCRYCSYFHARQALKSGISPVEIRRLMSGDISDCPEEEAVAVIYAQHWAESNTHPAADAVQRMQQVYGVEKAEAINLVLRMIRMGNLLGNSWDYLLHCISFGRARAQ